MKYVVNQLSILLLDRDESKGFNTIAYDYRTDAIMAIRPKEYFILKYISNSQGIPSENINQVSKDLQMNVADLEEILSDLVTKGILEQK